jgi:hypothetical protein
LYTYDPLNEFNSEGQGNPEFNLIERFETRQYLNYLSKLPNEKRNKAYRILLKEKEKYLDKKIKYLKDHYAIPMIIDEYQKQCIDIKNILKDNKYIEEDWIYHLYHMLRLEIEDDLSGKSCTIGTLEKVTKVKRVIKDYYEQLKQRECFKDLTDISKTSVLKYYDHKHKEVKKYLL